MDSSWLGSDDFFSSSSSSRRSRVSLLSTPRRSRLGTVADRIKIDFGPTDIDLDLDTSALRRSLLREFDTSALRSSLLREFDSFPAKTTSKLNKSASKHQETTEQKETVAESVNSETEFDTVRELRLKLQHSQEETSKLQAVITDLTQVNKRWQKYNNDRQIYVQKLLNTIQDQQEQLNHIGERSFTSPPPAKTESSQLGSHSPKTEEEVERLRKVEQKLKEKVSILEFQVKAHRDDWEAELSEKKQALKDKEAVELKLTELLTEMQLPTPVGERREGRVELYCQNCGQVKEFDRSPPSRSRMYRTAVHLPCSSMSSYHSSSTSISTTGDELVIDSSSKVADDQSAVWNIKADETSYSRSSTVPLVTRPSPIPVIVKSFVQIPVVKSSSMPEGNASKIPELPRMSLDSLEYSTNVPPVSSVHSSDQYAGVETLSAENVICLRCGQVFPPEMHLKFLDHFPKCQSNRKLNSVSKDSLPKV